ncbi:uncharacterized protein LOC134076175 [Sardina pilchardus]|uniref:uncharacterized protein LOC134076175 n=1 Tax=Sardina pilchardus TaxID=27697 RepID=UPI002E13EA38
MESEVEQTKLHCFQRIIWLQDSLLVCFLFCLVQKEFSADMKHLPYMVIVMTSWLCWRGHCSMEMKCADAHAQDGHAVHAHCVVSYSLIIGSCNFTTKFNETEVTYNIISTNKTKTELNVGIHNVNIKQHEITVNLTLSLYSDCAAPVQSTFTVNFTTVTTNTDKSFGKEDNPHKTWWVLGGSGIVIVIVIVGLVLFTLKRHRTYSGSSSLKLWKRTSSADTDVESNDDSSSRQGSDSEPLSGGQELRDTHTPPATSHTDDASS